MYYRYLFAFDNAPMGLVISGIDGNLLKSNRLFDRSSLLLYMHIMYIILYYILNYNIYYIVV